MGSPIRIAHFQSRYTFKFANRFRETIYECFGGNKKIFIDFLYHTPKENLNTEIKRTYPFCEEEKAERIIKEGVKGNLQKPMRKAEKGFTWFYINDEKILAKI